MDEMFLIFWDLIFLNLDIPHADLCNLQTNKGVKHTNASRKCSITVFVYWYFNAQWLRFDLGGSVGVISASKRIWFIGLRAQHPNFPQQSFIGQIIDYFK